MFHFLRWLLGDIKNVNRRVAPRYNDGASATMEVRGQEFHCRVVNVSQSGMLLSTTRRIEIGHTLLVRAPSNNGCTHLPLVVRRILARGDRTELGVSPDPNYPFSRVLLRNYARRFERNGPTPSAA